MRSEGAALESAGAFAGINPGWSVDDVHKHYSYENPHSDLYRYLSQWSDLEWYLNVGYSAPRQRHLHRSSHLRLIDRVAGDLIRLHNEGPYASDRRLLDIASGRGGPALVAHEKYRMRVVGVDLTPYNAHRAHRNAIQIGSWPEVQFVIGSALSLPLPDRSFPMAWSIESPAHFPDKPGFLREVARVLMPRGTFAFADLLVIDDIAGASRANRAVYENFLEVWDVPYLDTYSGYLRSIAQAGFHLQRSEIVTRYNLKRLERCCGIFLSALKSRVIYRTYDRYIRWRTGADLDNVYQHVLRSYQALQLGMIDYGLFWATRR
jgi:ubiquinone/menaquinone biosynthesis C-methylase UbiE